MAVMLNRDEIPPGTLYMLVLKTLARHGELHGYEISNAIQQISGEAHPAGVGQPAAGGGRVSVSGIAAHVGERLGDGKVGRNRWQPAGALLPANR